MFLTEQSGHARWIAGFILSNPGQRITARDIMRSYRALKAPEKRREMLDVMASLEALGWVRPEFQPDGRPSVAWHVNPKVHSLALPSGRRDERARREAVKETIYESVARYLKDRRETMMSTLSRPPCICRQDSRGDGGAHRQRNRRDVESAGLEGNPGKNTGHGAEGKACKGLTLASLGRRKRNATTRRQAKSGGSP